VQAIITVVMVIMCAFLYKWWTVYSICCIKHLMILVYVILVYVISVIMMEYTILYS